jgi:transcriptional regulator with XRE-family HTH domain
VTIHQVHDACQYEVLHDECHWMILHVNSIVCSNVFVDRFGASVKHLRASLGDSQQALAHRLGLSIRAIANYEAGSRPSRAALFKLGMLSAVNNLVDPTKEFSEVYVGGMTGRTDPTGQERVLVRIVLSLSRHQELVPRWREIAEKLVDSLDDLLHTLDQRSNAANGKSKMTSGAHLRELANTLDEAREWIREQQLESRARELSSKTKQPFFRAYLQVLRDAPEFSAQYAAAIAEFTAQVVTPTKGRRLEEPTNRREKREL